MQKEFDPFASYFRMRMPCANCPFRKKGAVELRPGRLEGIVADLLANDKKTFSCHKTLTSEDLEDFDDVDESEQAGRRTYYEAEKMCAGAAAYLLKKQRPSVGMRYALVTGSIPKDHWVEALPMVIDVIDTTN
ncbi:hypothetical protein [Pseudomonas sp. P108]|uniref:hypothetical protein n=1 Tax=Pseudomonas sp. P108 TaxID=1837993 RepID=UPI00293527DD|nr:hypothetical protein [Pseudomonas sp. P108]WNZ87335.1 hypothetical protein QOM10_30765 [Pseudomonas sp. P108]